MVACTACTLEFVHPMDLGGDPQRLYGAAYRGEIGASLMQDFAYRLKIRDSASDSFAVEQAVARNRLAACNYDAKVLEINSLGTKSAIMKPFMRARQKLVLSPKGYRLTKNGERYILPLLLAPFQRQGFVLLALAQPIRSPQPHRESTSATRET